MPRPTPWLCLLTALALIAPVAATAAPAPAASGAEERDEKPDENKTISADEEIDALLLPEYAETMTVTASRTEISILDAPVSVTIVGEEEIATSSAKNYADLLRGVPGLNVIQTSARDLNFRTRGAASTLETGQLALVDGRSIYHDFFGFVTWDMLPFDLEEVRQIEVLRGPGSAIWGANALNGVINVRTKTPRESQGGQFRFGGGEQGTGLASVRWADAPTDELSYRLAASYFEQDAWPRDDTLPNGDPIPPEIDFVNRGTRQVKGSLRMDYEPAEGKRWSFEAGAGRSSGILHTGIGPFQVDDDTLVGQFAVTYESFPVDVKIYANVLDGEASNLISRGVDGLPLFFGFDTWTYVAEATGRRTIGDKHLLVYGGSARYNDFRFSLAEANDDRREVGVFIEDSMLLGDKVTWNVGGRLDDFDTIGSTLSPRTSLIFKPRPNHAIRFAYNRAYRAPSFVNNALDTTLVNAITLPTGVFPFPSVAIGNADLDEEVMDAFEVAYTVNLGERGTFTAALYHNEVEDLIDLFPAAFYSAGNPPPGWPLPPALVPPDTLPALFTYRNIGEVTDEGVELSYNVSFNDHFAGTFSYTWQDEPEVRSDTAELPINVPPRHQLSAGVSFRFADVFGSFGLSYTDEAFWTDVLDERFFGETDDYFLVDASVGVELLDDKLVLVFSGTNLLDADAKQHVYGDIIGRRLTAELRARW